MRVTVRSVWTHSKYTFIATAFSDSRMVMIERNFSTRVRLAQAHALRSDWLQVLLLPERKDVHAAFITLLRICEILFVSMSQR